MAMVANTSREAGRRRRLEIWGGTAALMLLPLIAIRGTDAAAWDPPGDFMLLAILLVGLGAAYELASRVKDRRAYRVGLGIAVAAALLQIWINLAVGVVGSEDNPANLIYAGVLGVALGGALLARFRAPGMARAMIATAAAQGMAFVVALAAGLGFTGPITVFFGALWLIAAWLFRRAARQEMAD